MNTEFWLVAYSPETGEEYRREPWPAGREINTLEAAMDVASDLGVSIDCSGDYVPSCCGDLRVEFRRDPDNAVAIYCGESFYFAREGS
jgi:hypothetical protein